MNFYENEMRTMFDSHLKNPVYAGKTVLARLTDNLRVKLQFVTTGMGNQYSAVQITIINKNEGVVDKALIKFSDVLGMYTRESDKAKLNYHMWDYNGKSEWYTPIIGLQKKEFAKRVIDYIELYKF